MSQADDEKDVIPYDMELVQSTPSQRLKACIDQSSDNMKIIASKMRIARTDIPKIICLTQQSLIISATDQINFIVCILDFLPSLSNFGSMVLYISKYVVTLGIVISCICADTPVIFIIRELFIASSRTAWSTLFVLKCWEALGECLGYLVSKDKYDWKNVSNSIKTKFAAGLLSLAYSKAVPGRLHAVHLVYFFADHLINKSVSIFEKISPIYYARLVNLCKHCIANCKEWLLLSSDSTLKIKVQAEKDEENDAWESINLEYMY